MTSKQEPNRPAGQSAPDALPSVANGGGDYQFTPLDAIIGLEDELAAAESPIRSSALTVDPADAVAQFRPDGSSDEEADLSADIFPAVPVGARRSQRPSGGSGLNPAMDLDSRQVQQGTHSGDKYIRRARPSDDGFRRLSPGHLEALPGTLEPTSGAGRIFGTLKRFLIGSPISTAAAAHERLSKVKALACCRQMLYRR